MLALILHHKKALQQALMSARSHAEHVEKLVARDIPIGSEEIPLEDRWAFDIQQVLTEVEASLPPVVAGQEAYQQAKQALSQHSWASYAPDALTRRGDVIIYRRGLGQLYCREESIQDEFREMIEGTFKGAVVIWAVEVVRKGVINNDVVVRFSLPQPKGGQRE